MTEEHIKKYWESQGVTYGDSHWASWGDNFAIDLEIETISKYIKNGDSILDVGCANGYSAFRQAELHQLTSIIGVDFASSMVNSATKTSLTRHLNCKIEFKEGDIRSLEFPDNMFDVVYTTRTLINLPTWAEQISGVNECIRVAKPGGVIVFSEGFWEPLALLNSIRQLNGMSLLEEHDFNRYLKKKKLESYLDELNLDYSIEDFSSIYYLGTRFLRELVTDYKNYPGFTNPINEIFYELEKKFSGGGMGIQQAVIVRK